MTKEIWINLPVKDVARSKAFFAKMGLSFSPNNETPSMAAMIVGEKKTAVMLIEEGMFKGFSRLETNDTATSCEVLLSIDAETREEVDEMANKAAAAGGNVFAKPAENQGWMYGCAFTDPDGHRWNVLHMDMSKMPK